MRAFLCSLVSLFALTLFGCGKLENASLRQGVVKGQLGGVVKEGGFALVRERTQLRTELDSEGRFELRDVPSGKVELYLVGSSEWALLWPVEVPPGSVVDVGLLSPLAAARLGIRVRVDDGTSPQGAQVSVRGTPFHSVETDAHGRAELWPLPSGCYFVRAEISGLGSDEEEVCLKPGETAAVEIDLEVDDLHACAERGCEDGKVCAEDGRCVECTDNVQCAVGLTCENEICVGQLPACAVCARNEQCGVTGRCEANEDRGACRYPCDGSGGCVEPGFSCESGWCLPEPKKFEGCGAIQAVGASCLGPEECREAGLVNGLCLDGHCTVSCESGELCPSGEPCALQSGQWVCP